jgi:uncharacterized protein
VTTQDTSPPLSAPLDIAFDYTRSLGQVLGEFFTGLTQRRVTGVRACDGRVIVPPAEFDPVTAQPLTELVEVADTGEVVSWSWCPDPVEGQPVTRPFAWALIRLDGADTALLHAVDVDSPADIRTGLRVRARWSDTPTGHIRDIVYFEAEGTHRPAAPTPQPPPAAASPGILVTPVQLHYQHSVSPEESRYLQALDRGRLVGQRCPSCTKVYIPPRGACPTCGVPTTTEAALPDVGTVTTFCVVNVPFLGQRIEPPYVAAYILLDGADIAFLHLVLGCDPAEVRMGLRVEAVWRPREQWNSTLANIDHFAPSGEPDAPFESYARHL